MATYEENIEGSLAELYALSGSTVDPTLAARTLDQAATIVETISGAVLSAAYREQPISRTDAYWLSRAIVFQAAWLLEQPDVMSRLAVDSLSQDGISVSAPNGLTFVLAPMAKRALSNCTWAKTGTIQVEGVQVKTDISFLTNDNHPWTPMGVN